MSSYRDEYYAKALEKVLLEGRKNNKIRRFLQEHVAPLYLEACVESNHRIPLRIRQSYYHALETKKLCLGNLSFLKGVLGLGRLEIQRYIHSQTSPKYTTFRDLKNLKPSDPEDILRLKL